MSQQVPTVKVKASSERGWRIINQSAFDPSVHQLFRDAPEAVAIEAAADEPSKVSSEPVPAAELNLKRGPGRPRRHEG